MNANLFGLYAQAGALAKSNAETAAARSVRIAGLLQDGARRWVDGVTASVGETARIVQDFGKVRSPADIAELQRAWLQAASARAAENVKSFIDLSQKIAAEVTVPVAPAAAPATRVEAPKAAAPKVEAKPAAKIEAPTVAAAPAPKAAEKMPAAKPVAKKAAAPAPKAVAEVEAKAAPVAKVEAPKAVAAPAPKAEPVKAETPKAVAPAPKVEAAKVEAKPVAAPAPVAAPVAAPVTAPVAPAPKTAAAE